MPLDSDIARHVQVFPDLAALSRAAADRVIAATAPAIRKRGRFSIVLAGGSTPKALYTLLAAGAKVVDWVNVHVFFGDERCVAPGDKDSNFRSAAEALLSRVPIQGSNVRRIRGELGPVAAAAEYDQLITAYLAEHVAFDLVLLGVGADGHTASLFPGRDFAGDAARRGVAAVAPAGFPVRDRVTLTVDALAAARESWTLAAGSDKAETIARAVAQRSTKDPRLPITRVWAASSNFTWMLDTAAASGLGLTP
ncbi:MAG: 6-phosphogluconolactonase [Planctomycetota bacterium]